MYINSLQQFCLIHISENSIVNHSVLSMPSKTKNNVFIYFYYNYFIADFILYIVYVFYTIQKLYMYNNKATERVALDEIIQPKESLQGFFVSSFYIHHVYFYISLVNNAKNCKNIIKILPCLIFIVSLNQDLKIYRIVYIGKKSYEYNECDNTMSS